jgi:D-glycero-D-manno-heptose 1,7-bisphosphate phosphatase
MNRAVFLDRDGTLNEDSGYFHEADKLVVFPEVPEALRLLKDAGFQLFVVTNQSGIGRGMYPQEDMEDVHQALQEYLLPFKVQVDDFFFCPHAEEDACSCRKPLPGMLFDAQEKYDLDLSASYLVGDHPSDMEAGTAAGCTTVFVLTGDGLEEFAKLEGTGKRIAKFVATDMLDAARLILVHESRRAKIMKS